MLTGEYNSGNNTAIEIPKLDMGLTVIVAIKESDSSVLLAADGEVLEGDAIREVKAKLRKHPSAPLAWGATGNTTIDYDFTKWLQEYAWPPSNEDVFREQLINKLSELNGKQRELTSLAKAQIKEDYLCSVSLVGYLNKLMLLELDDVGRASLYDGIGFQAIGSGKGHAWIAYKMLKTASDLSQLNKLKIIMQTVITTAPRCGLPIEIWRVTEKGIETIT